jgi:hypothetical protein
MNPIVFLGQFAKTGSGQTEQENPSSDFLVVAGGSMIEEWCVGARALKYLDVKILR